MGYKSAKEIPDNLYKLLNAIWDEIELGSTDTKHPFRYPAIATYHPEKGLEQRVVVLRRFVGIKNYLVFFTDERSAKVEDLKTDPQIHWLFYHPKKQFQVRAKGLATLHNKDQISRTYWSQMKEHGILDYGSIHAPGSVYELNEPTHNEISIANAYDNFCVVKTELFQLECLQLNKKEHRRARFIKMENVWQGEWLVP